MAQLDPILAQVSAVEKTKRAFNAVSLRDGDQMNLNSNIDIWNYVIA